MTFYTSCRKKKIISSGAVIFMAIVLSTSIVFSPPAHARGLKALFETVQNTVGSTVRFVRSWKSNPVREYMDEWDEISQNILRLQGNSPQDLEEISRLKARKIQLEEAIATRDPSEIQGEIARIHSERPGGSETPTAREEFLQKVLSARAKVEEHFRPGGMRLDPNRVAQTPTPIDPKRARTLHAVSEDLVARQISNPSAPDIHPLLKSSLSALADKDKKVSLISADSGVGVTTGMDSFAKAIGRGDVPSLAEYRVLKINILSVERELDKYVKAGKNRDVKTFVDKLFTEISSESEVGPVLIFVDSLHPLASSSTETVNDLHRLPLEVFDALSRRIEREQLDNVRLVGAVANRHYTSVSEHLKSGERSIHRIDFQEVANFSTLRLEALRIAKEHEVFVPDEVIKAAIKLSKDFIKRSGEGYTKNAMEILEEAMLNVARARSMFEPKEIPELKSRIAVVFNDLQQMGEAVGVGHKVYREIALNEWARLEGEVKRIASEVEGFAVSSQLRNRINDLFDAVEKMQGVSSVNFREVDARLSEVKREIKDWISERNDSQQKMVRLSIGDLVDVAVVKHKEQMSNVNRFVLTERLKLEVLDISERDRYWDQIRRNFREKYAGHEEVVETFLTVYRRAVEGFGRDKGPMATFLLIGKPGTGKTYFAEVAARIIGSADAILRAEAQFLQSKEAMASFMKGAPAGYVRSEEPSILLDYMMKNRYGIILFDEALRATGEGHSALKEGLLQFREAKKLRDFKGNEADLDGQLLVLTDNVFQDMTVRNPDGSYRFPEFSREELGKLSAFEHSEFMRSRLIELARERSNGNAAAEAAHVFSEANLRGIDYIFFYGEFTRDEIRDMYKLMVKSLFLKRIEAKKTIINVRDEVIESLVERTLVDANASDIRRQFEILVEGSRSVDGHAILSEDLREGAFIDVFINEAGEIVWRVIDDLTDKQIHEHAVRLYDEVVKFWN